MLTVIAKQFSKVNVPFSLLVAMGESLEGSLSSPNLVCQPFKL